MNLNAFSLIKIMLSLNSSLRPTIDEILNSKLILDFKNEYSIKNKFPLGIYDPNFSLDIFHISDVPREIDTSENQTKNRNEIELKLNQRIKISNSPFSKHTSKKVNFENGEDNSKFQSVQFLRRIQEIANSEFHLTLSNNKEKSDYNITEKIKIDNIIMNNKKLIEIQFTPTNEIPIDLNLQLAKKNQRSKIFLETIFKNGSVNCYLSRKNQSRRNKIQKISNSVLTFSNKI